jgi:GTP diphosphokinase / guanosine-3',5'-bis(diphosphate) 3'-diphosphatase
MVQTIEEFKKLISSYSPEAQETILRAARKSEVLHEGQLRESGEPYLIHPLQVAEILIRIKLDEAAIVSALLHDVLEDTRMTRQDLRKEFGKEVEQLVNGVTKIAAVKAQNKSVQTTETIRKMLFAMVKDIRVILIKLADKLHNMRTLEYKKEHRRRAIAQETLDIYAPLASRLGIAWLKDELQDLALKHINKDAYEQIKAYVAERRGERSDYLERVEATIREAAEAEKVEVVVETRAKHFYSIYQKMRRRGKEMDEIFDFLGTRIMCKSLNDCYTVLGLVHRLWPPIEGRFKDFIAMPKANRYQSLHTTVMGFDGKLLEIQIRTEEMHHTAEFGIAAHWLYKQGLSREEARREDLAVLNRVRDLGGIRLTSNEFLDEIKREILKDCIYVFTPKGDVIQLPRGATAIDFAYHIHTEVGHHTMAAKADGNIVPLRAELTNTQVIEVITSPHAHPHLNWLRYARTARTKQKIRHWLNKNDESLILDKSIVARKRTKPAAPQTKGGTPGSAGKGKATPPESTSIMDTSKVGVRVGDERNMMIRFAQCCHPTTGDDIVGYISRGRGIIVHKKGCRNLQFISDIKARRIEVEWETVSPRETRRFRVVARHTVDLFSEIEGAIRKFKGSLIEGKVEENESGKLEAIFTIELDRKDDFKKVMKNVRTIPQVLTIASADNSDHDSLE